jgi:hypothetical protein
MGRGSAQSQPQGRLTCTRHSRKADKAAMEGGIQGWFAASGEDRYDP